jgi:hypothetical protein
MNKMDFRDKGHSVEDLTFREPTFAKVVDDDTLENEVPDSMELRMRWGSNLEYDDYVWLEREFSEWKKTHKCDTKAEEILLIQICLTGLSIRKSRDEGKEPSGLLELYQKLMKTANVDPSKTAIVGAGKSQDTFSSFVKTIEETEPAEFLEDRPKYKDFDKIEWYFYNYVRRPLINFLGLSREFTIVAEEDIPEADDVLFPSEEDQNG